MVSIPAKMLEPDQNDLKPINRSDDSLDGPMVLLDHVVEVLRLAQFDVRAAVGTNT